MYLHSYQSRLNACVVNVLISDHVSLLTSYLCFSARNGWKLIEKSKGTRLRETDIKASDLVLKQCLLYNILQKPKLSYGLLTFWTPFWTPFWSPSWTPWCHRVKIWAWITILRLKKRTQTSRTASERRNVPRRGWLHAASGRALLSSSLSWTHGALARKHSERGRGLSHTNSRS